MQKPKFPINHGMQSLMVDSKTVNKKIKETRKPILLNHILAVQKQGNWKLSEQICSDLLTDNDGNCVKALFRRGKSRVRLKEFHAAREDLQRAESLDNTIAPQVRRELVLLRRLEKEEHKKAVGNKDMGKILKAVLAEPRSKAEILAQEEKLRKAQAVTRRAERRARGEDSSSDDNDGSKSGVPQVPVRMKENSRARINNGTPEKKSLVMGRVSVICPTTESRHNRHPQLYGSFICQYARDKELIVIDTGFHPSYFFSCLSDSRVKYYHIEGPEDAMTVGTKRNRALTLASGEYVAHFDDDDLYAPPYLDGMLQAMNRGAGHVCKLAAWYVLDTETGVCGHYDNNYTLPEPFEEHREKGLFTGGYGFSLIYKREVALRIRFCDTSWGEDYYFLNMVRAAGVPVTFTRDTELFCLHTQHGSNLSRSIAQTLVPPRQWQLFLGQFTQHVMLHMRNLSQSKPPVEISGKWDVTSFLSRDIHEAMKLGPAQLQCPAPAAEPIGLFVCSLYDEYFNAIHEQQRGLVVVGPNPLDPLSRWSDNCKIGMRSWPTLERGGVRLAPSPLKPLEDLANKLVQ